MVRICVSMMVLLFLFWNSNIFATTGVLSITDIPGCADIGNDDVGDPGADDSACIRRWLKKAEKTGRKDLYVPSGTYLYRSSFVLPSGVHIRCAGPETVFKNNGGPGNFIFNDTDTVEDVIIENCGFDVNGGTADFLTIIGVNPQSSVVAPSRNIHIRGNRMYDSAISGMPSAQQRQYILLSPCDKCWIENNHLSEGGRIKVGRPGNQIFIKNNVLENVNDNAITVG